MGICYDHHHICTWKNLCIYTPQIGNYFDYRGDILVMDESSSELTTGIDLSTSPDLSMKSPFERKYGGFLGSGKVIELLLSILRIEAIEGLASASS